MCIINLGAIFSQSTDLPQAGMMFYDKIKEAFDSSDKVVVDMENITALPSIFLNVSIGKIICEFGIDRLKSSMSFSKITKSQALRLQEYLTKFSPEK